MEWTRRVEEVWTARAGDFTVTAWTSATQTPTDVRPVVGSWHVKVDDMNGRTVMAGEDDTRMGVVLAAKDWLRAFAIARERDPYPTESPTS